VGATLVRKHPDDYQGQVGLPPPTFTSQFSARHALRVPYLVGDVEAFALIDSDCSHQRKSYGELRRGPAREGAFAESN
jgi:hypothetical protein